MWPLVIAKMSYVFFAAPSCVHKFFFLPPWWEYLKTNADCSVNFNPNNNLGDVWLVGLAIIDILIRIVAFLAVLSVFIGSIEYIISIGNPEKITNARKRIINSLVGVAIAFSAVAVVTFAGRQLGG